MCIRDRSQTARSALPDDDGNAAGFPPARGPADWPVPDICSLVNSSLSEKALKGHIHRSDVYKRQAFSLLVFYRDNNANPLVYSFATELFAYIAVMFTLYGAAAFFFGKDRPRLVFFASLSSIYLLVTCLLYTS